MTTTKPKPSELGNLVRLNPFETDELPAHPSLQDSKPRPPARRPQLATFLQAFLNEGLEFSELFHTEFHQIGTKSAFPSTAPVDTLTLTIPGSRMSLVPRSGGNIPVPVPSYDSVTPPAEFWVARRSYHSDEKAKGTASWSEFEYGLRDDHSKHEEEFTPTLYDARSVLDWNTSVKLVEKDIHGFNTITMSIHEMCHSLQFPLKPRCFPVLVVTANVSSDSPSSSSSSTPDAGFIAITVPVALSAETSPTAFYSSGRHISEGATPQHRAKPVFGVYAAVERVMKVPSPGDAASPSSADVDKSDRGSRNGKEGQIEWIMATASDAKGNVPMFAQKLGMPGVVVKDVGYFMEWIRKLNPVS